MKKVINISEMVETVETAAGLCDVCAVADANYDESTGRLVMSLDSVLRTTDLRRAERRVEAGWLPKGESLEERVDPGEASDAAKAIFQRWVQKVRQAVPALTHH